MIASRRTALVWTLGLTALALYLALFLRTVWRIGDEGTLVYGAQRVAEGEVPYRDFVEVMGPGSFYWLALWFKALGTTWFASRLAVLVTALGSAWAIHYITTRHYRGAFAVLPAALYSLISLPQWPGANHHFDSNLWALLAFAVFVSRPRPSRCAAVATGILAGLASAVMPQKGVFVMAALIVSTLLDRGPERSWRRALGDTCWMILPFATVGISLVAFFAANGALRDLLNATVVWPATRYGSVNAVPYAYGLSELYIARWSDVFHATFAPTVAAALTVAVSLPLVFAASLPFFGVAYVLHRGGAAAGWLSPVRSLPWSYVLVGFALVASEWHRKDFLHLCYGSPVLLVVVITWLAQLEWTPARVGRRGLAACALLLALALAAVASLAHQRMDTRTGSVAMFQKDEALAFIHANVPQGEPVFVYPYYPLYYFLADVRNPTRYSILLYAYNTRAEFEDAIHALESQQVRYVLWDTVVAGANLRQWFPGYREPPAEQQLLERYLEANYSVIAVKGGFRILERCGSTCMAASSLPPPTPVLETTS